MSPSSRASIPPYSRPPSSSRPGVVTPAQKLWHRYMLAGAALGLFLSLGVVLPASGHTGIAWQGVLLSTIFSTTIAALLMASAGLLVLVFAHAFPALRPHASRLAAGLGALVAFFYVAGRGTAEAFRFASGSPLNLGILEFLAAGIGHLFLPVTIEYAPIAISLTLLSVGLSWLCFLWLRKPVEQNVGAVALLTRGASSAALLVLLLQALTTPGMAKQAGLNKTADLSFLSSIAARVEEQQLMQEEAKRLGVVVPRGPRLEKGQLWEDTVARMAGPRPNVLLVMMESVGINHLGYQGYARPTTPNIDRIAERSVRFDNARATATHSNYAQMAVLSSLFPRRFSGLDTYKRLDYPRVLWHDFLGALDYATATHSSQDETWQGMIRFQQTETPTEFHHARTYEGQRIRMGSEKIVPDEVTVTRAIKWIDRTSGPWGVYVNLQATHFPYRVPPGVKQPYQPIRPTRGKFHYLGYPQEDVPTVRNRYDNALTYIDEQVGRLFDYLKRSRKLDNTVVVVTSDHGELFWEHGMVTHGRSLVEEEVRVPLLLHYPKALRPHIEQRPVSTLDVLPTLATLLQVPPHPAFQGRSLLELDATENTPTFMNIQGMKSQDGVVCGNYKFVHDRSGQQDRLYDWSRDPKEEHDLVGELPHVAEALRTLLSAQMREQMRYHKPQSPKLRQARYAPRFAECPDVASLAMASAGTD